MGLWAMTKKLAIRLAAFRLRWGIPSVNEDEAMAAAMYRMLRHDEANGR